MAGQEGSQTPERDPESIDLRCYESLYEPAPRRFTSVLVEARPCQDRAPVEDVRMFWNLLKREGSNLPPVPDYLATVQKEIQPKMRETVASWMLEVCLDFGMQHSVFCLAITYLDKFLSKTCIPKGSLQLAGSACLFLSSKVLTVTHIPSKEIILYTASSITMSDLMKFEMMVLKALEWELNLVDPVDLMEQIISKIGLSSKVDLIDLGHRTKTMISLAMTHYEFAYVKPSLLVTTSLIVSLKNYSEANKVEVIEDVKDFDAVRDLVMTICKIKKKDVEDVSQLITNLVLPFVDEFPQGK